MKITRLEGHALQASEFFGAVWEVQLETGEATQPHQHPSLEELYCCVEGAGSIYLGEEKRRLERGGLVYVPRLTNHWLENDCCSLLRCLNVESYVAKEAPAREAETVGNLERQIHTLPSQLNEAEAIQRIVQLFDIAGRLSEQIEEALGLDNQDGVGALERIERRIMEAVVEITKRYERSRFDLDGFGGRLRSI